MCCVNRLSRQSLADIATSPDDVRFTPKSRHCSIQVAAALKGHVLQYAGEPFRVHLNVHRRRADRRVARDLGDRLEIDPALGQPRECAARCAMRRPLSRPRRRAPSEIAPSSRASSRRPSEGNDAACDAVALPSQSRSPYFSKTRRSTSDEMKTSRVRPPLVYAAFRCTIGRTLPASS